MWGPCVYEVPVTWFMVNHHQSCIFDVEIPRLDPSYVIRTSKGEVRFLLTKELNSESARKKSASWTDAVNSFQNLIECFRLNTVYTVYRTRPDNKTSQLYMRYLMGDFWPRDVYTSSRHTSLIRWRHVDVTWASMTSREPKWRHADSWIKCSLCFGGYSQGYQLPTPHQWNFIIALSQIDRLDFTFLLKKELRSDWYSHNSCCGERLRVVKTWEKIWENPSDPNCEDFCSVTFGAQLLCRDNL